MKIQIQLLFVALLAMSVCTTVHTVENAQPVAQRQMVTDQRIISDASLDRKVSILGVNQAIATGGLLKVPVEVQNRTRSLQCFLYHFEWFEANEMEVHNALSASIPEQIEGDESKFISSIASNPNCKDFRVKFIKAN